MTTRKQRVHDALKENGPMTLAELNKALKIDRRTKSKPVLSSLTTLRKEGLVVVVGHRTSKINRPVYVYGLAEAVEPPAMPGTVFGNMAAQLGATA